MDRKQIILSREQLCGIARYEKTFRDYLGDTPFDEADFICPEPYRYTLEDLCAALERMLDTDPAVGEMGESWLYPIRELDEVFGLTEACTIPEEPQNTYPRIFTEEGYYFQHVWWVLEDAWELENGDRHVSDIADIKNCLNSARRYLSNKGKPVPKWTFTNTEKRNYIALFNEDEMVKNASEEALALARCFADELCEANDATALYLKGYACYGGNRLYLCDWEESRDCMIKLYKIDDDPHYMNTLGYIYYYGRTNNGIPEYGKALHCFSVAAANGLYEGAYKLADMYHHGYGCEKSDRSARSLYGMVYDDSRKRFLHGVDGGNFADAAFRMGNVYADGIGEKPDYAEAYAFFLQAVYAARLRLETDDFFGNQTVAIGAGKRLEEIRAKLPKGYLKKEVRWNDLRIIPWYFLDKNQYQRLQLSAVPKEDGGFVLTVSRRATRAVPEPEYVLITLTELSFCKRTRELSLETSPETKLWMADRADTVRFDFMQYNEVEGRWEFYEEDTLTAWVRSDYYFFRNRDQEEENGRMCCVVGVRFENSQKTYDYLSDIEGLEPGDRVIVNGFNGETVVTVVSIQAKKESELALPAEKYKKILRKAG